jgi:hypothetical protein
MAHDHDDDIRPAAEAPQAWTDAMVQAALEAGVAIETPSGPSVSKALKRAAERIGAWADDPALGRDVLRLLESGRALLDPPLMRATLSPGAELAVSAALLHWPSARSDELEAIARAQTLLAAGAKLGIAGAPSPAALDALDAAARIADPHRAATALRSSSARQAMRRPTSSTTRTPAPAPAQRLQPAHAPWTRRWPNSPSKRCATGLNAEHGGVQIKAANARLNGAPDADIIAALSGRRGARRLHGCA